MISQGGKTYMKRKNRFRLIRGMLLLVICICMINIGREYSSSAEHGRYQEQFENVLRISEIVEIMKDSAESLPDIMEPTVQSEESIPDESFTEGQEPVMLTKFSALYAENEDIVGWLSIPGTVIDYPVMQCEDNEYYLHHNFYGEEDRYGCLFVKDIADVDTPGTNFIIYGHNMKDGSMFGDLDKYGKRSFYEEHPNLSFDTLFEERTYEILAVFRSRVYPEEDDTFKYYQFYQAETEEEFKSFYENIMDMAIYDTGATAEFGDTFLMLSTCAYHEENGRLVIVAKKLTP